MQEITGRIIAIIIFVASIITQPEFFTKMGLSMPEMQMVVGTIVVAIILFIDPIVGVLIGTAALIAYYRLNNFEIAPSYAKNKRYITEKTLEDAQNNVVSDSSDYIGVSGVNGENVYSAQGAPVDGDSIIGYEDQNR